jgi:RimJ/RimL family protein N-acetyltransferase
MFLETNRLIIREYTLEDMEAVHVYASDPLVAVYTIWGPNTREDTAEFLNRVQEFQLQEPRVDYELAVTLKDSGALIGGVGIHITEPRQAEMGYCLNPQYWRLGYATEAASAMVQFGFRQLGIHRIYATCRPDNIGSASVMKKIGMTYEGHLREHRFFKGKWHDSFQYSILEREPN